MVEDTRSTFCMIYPPIASKVVRTPTCPWSFDEALKVLMKVNPKGYRPRKENSSFVRTFDRRLLHNAKTMIIIGLVLTEA